jgi:hypothetical protein
MKIFWSWQSDTPGKTGRHLIRESLRAAIDALKKSDSVEEPIERESKNGLHLDHDRAGVSGSPDLARLIFEKIEASTVFVADVTPVSVVQSGESDGGSAVRKRNMNPNVAIELGYALKAVSDRNVLMVLNTHYGDRSYLPFDLAHKAGPIQFELAPDANKEARDAVFAQLTGDFVTALRPFVQGQTGHRSTSKFPKTPTTISDAVYFQVGDVLAEFGDDSDRTSYVASNGCGFYLRVTPQSPLVRPFTRSELYSKIRRAALRPLWPNHSGLFACNAFGAAVVEPLSPNGGAVKALSQVFTNGEIWGVAPWLLMDGNLGKYVPGPAFETTFRGRLSDYTKLLAKDFGIPLPYTIEAGAVGLKDYWIFAGQNPDDRFGPIYDDAFKFEMVLNDLTSDALDKVANGIFEALYRASGYQRPPE